MTSAGTTRICAGGLLVRGGQILLARRSGDRKFYPGVWDIIGGHCEGGEAPADALVRELEEEIGVKAHVFEEIAVLEEPQPAEHGDARYHVFVVTSWGGGEPRLLGAEHSELRCEPCSRIGSTTCSSWVWQPLPRRIGTWRCIRTRHLTRHSSGPLARIRSPRPLTASVRRHRIGAEDCAFDNVTG